MCLLFLRIGDVEVGMNIQWYPGHMTKAKRQIVENLKLVDVIIELADSRIPRSSRNPEIDEIRQKPRILVFTKGDLADPEITRLWVDFWRVRGEEPLVVDVLKGKGIDGISQAVIKAASSKRTVPRALVVGIPNVGKSSLINRLAGRTSAKVGAKPGVTRGKQWIKAGSFQLLDTPGLLWPRFDDQEVARRLAVVSSIRDEILDSEELGFWLLEYLKENYINNLRDRYKLDRLDGNLLEEIGKKRGCLGPGGVVRTERAAKVVIDDFRSGRLGRVSLETPDNGGEF